MGVLKGKSSIVCIVHFHVWIPGGSSSGWKFLFHNIPGTTGWAMWTWKKSPNKPIIWGFPQMVVSKMVAVFHGKSRQWTMTGARGMRPLIWDVTVISGDEGAGNWRSTRGYQITPHWGVVCVCVCYCLISRWQGMTVMTIYWVCFLGLSHYLQMFSKWIQ